MKNSSAQYMRELRETCGAQREPGSSPTSQHHVVADSASSERLFSSESSPASPLVEDCELCVKLLFFLLAFCVSCPAVLGGLRESY